MMLVPFNNLRDVLNSPNDLPVVEALSKTG